MRYALIVDDEVLIRRKVSEILQLYGFEHFLEAENGQQAVELAVQHQPLLVVMDVTMPVMDGLTAAEKISSSAPAPLVLLTGNADRQTIETACRSGVLSYVVKPFSAEQLCAAVDLAVHQFMALSDLRERVRKLEDTLETRKQVEKAKGLLMLQGLSEAEAYRKLQKLAMRKRKTLREIAEAVLLMAD